MSLPSGEAAGEPAGLAVKVADEFEFLAQIVAGVVDGFAGAGDVAFVPKFGFVFVALGIGGEVFESVEEASGGFVNLLNRFRKFAGAGGEGGERFSLRVVVFRVGAKGFARGPGFGGEDGLGFLETEFFVLEKVEGFAVGG